MHSFFAAALNLAAKKSGIHATQHWLSRHQERHGKYLPAAYFLLGFLFDVFTLSRIDAAFTLIQQALFIVLIGFLLSVRLRLGEEVVPKSKILAKLHKMKDPFLHFMFGSLLSAYTLFFFKSSSWTTSLVFVAVLIGLMVLNETKLFRHSNIWFKLILFSLCISSYLSYLVPILVGKVGKLTFSASMFSSLALYSGLGWLIIPSALRKTRDAKRLLALGLLPPLVMASFYFLKIVPPVPVSIEQIGIYHDVKREGDEFILYSLRPWWRFWQRSDVQFEAREKDKVYCFARIFSPTRFDDQVSARWMFRNPFGEWQTTDRIPIRIVGGRDEGFRGVTFKENYAPGRWQVRFETRDGREIGRIHFSVSPDTSASNREFRIERI